MKKYFAFAAIAIAALVSCNKEIATEIPEAPARDGYVELTLSAGLEAGSKAVLDGNTVVWAVGDEVAVYPDASTKAETFTVTAVDFDAVKLSGSVPAGTTSLIAVYPAAQAALRDGNLVRVAIPDTQYIPADGNIDPAAMSSVAYFSTTSAKPQFKNVFSLIEFEMSKGSDIEGVVFYSDFSTSEYAPGVVSVEVSTAGEAPVITNLCGGISTTVFPTGGFVAGKKYIAVVPPCPEAKGFTMAAKGGGRVGHKTASETKAFERNKGFSVGDALATVTFKYDYITTAEQLKNFLAEASTYTAEDNVYLGNDIDLSGFTLTTAETWAGKFYGQGFSLKNWTSDGVALFGTSTGLIEGIVLDASCRLSYPYPTYYGNSTDDGKGSSFGFVVCFNDGTLRGCTNNAPLSQVWETNIGRAYYGMIFGNTNVKNALVEDCHNTAEIYIQWNGLESSCCPYFGAVGGRGAGTVGELAVSNCTNSGNIIYKNIGKGNNYYLGAVFGCVNYSGIIKDCKNYGNVALEYVLGGSGAYVNLGGVVGYTAAKIENCVNEGDVTYTSPKDVSVTRPNIGGVAGYVAGGIEDSSNSGAITVTGMFAHTNTSSIPSSAGTNPYPCIGGVAGIVGHNTATKVCNRCHNTGKVTLDAGTDGAGYMRVGGVAGAINGSVEDCVNDGEVEVKSTGKQTAVGGIAGFCIINTDGELEWANCLNHGNITYTNAQANTTFSYIGGIVGNTNKKYITKNCHNTADIVSVSASQVRVGGIGACTKYLEDCSNTGKLIMRNATSAGHKDGQPDDELSYASSMGGISGFGQGDMVRCAVDCEMVNESAANTFIGGLVGGYGNTAQNYYDDSIDVRMTASSGVCVGIVSGGTINNKSSVKYGLEGQPITVASTTTINGVAVTAADLADKDKLVGYLQKDSGFDVYTEVVNVVLN
ncbi:MAG: hypothetical protein J5640_07375 [Bacteroidales bacterium]|nr:hypothetical protein [Bacteroidales bacterium]